MSSFSVYSHCSSFHTKMSIQNNFWNTFCLQKKMKVNFWNKEFFVAALKADFKLIFFSGSCCLNSCWNCPEFWTLSRSSAGAVCSPETSQESCSSLMGFSRFKLRLQKKKTPDLWGTALLFLCWIIFYFVYIVLGAVVAALVNSLPFCSEIILTAACTSSVIDFSSSA